MITINVFNVKQVKLDAIVNAFNIPSMINGRMIVVYKNKNDFWTVEGKLDNVNAFQQFCYLLHNMLRTDIDLASADNIFYETFENEDFKNTKVYVVKIILHPLPEGVHAKPLKYMFDFDSKQSSTVNKDIKTKAKQMYMNQQVPLQVDIHPTVSKDNVADDIVCNKAIIKRIDTFLKGATVFINIDICDEKKEYYHIHMTVNKQDYDENELANQVHQLIALYLDQRKLNVFADEFMLKMQDDYDNTIVPIQLKGCVRFK